MVSGIDGYAPIVRIFLAIITKMRVLDMDMMKKVVERMGSRPAHYDGKRFYDSSRKHAETYEIGRDELKAHKLAHEALEARGEKKHALTYDLGKASAKAHHLLMKTH
jgi:hypothetical protein